jgi:Uma2 family endonuclease
MARELLKRGATMTAMTKLTADDLSRIDQCVYMYVDWAGYEALDRARGDHPAPRITYLDGVAELMSPSKFHERINYRIGHLIEAYCTGRGIVVEGYGSWTLKDESLKAGAEPDCCYVFSTKLPEERPDLSVEVVWTSGGLDKLEVWRRMRVPEVWFWIDDVITIHELGPNGYEQVDRSPRLPELELSKMYELLGLDSTQEAAAQMRAYAANQVRSSV